MTCRRWVRRRLGGLVIGIDRELEVGPANRRAPVNAPLHVPELLALEYAVGEPADVDRDQQQLQRFEHVGLVVVEACRASSRDLPPGS